MKLFKYTLLGLLSIVALITTAKEQLVTLLRNGEVVASFKSSDIKSMMFFYQRSIYPVDENGSEVNGFTSWNKEMNMAIFAIKPKELLDEYTPTYELSENLEPYAHNGKVMEVDKANGLVYVYFSTPRKAGQGFVTVTLGEGDEAEKATVTVTMYPEVQSVTFYGPTAGDEIANRPYLKERPGLGLERQYWALECEKTISLNQEDEIRVAVNVAGGEMEDILEAIKCCKWLSWWGSLEETESLKIISDSYEIVEGQGFDAILKVVSTDKPGQVQLAYETPCPNEKGGYETLHLTYNVSDINAEHPVQEIIVASDDVEVNLNRGYSVIVEVVPESSWIYQRIEVSVADPEIADAQFNYSGSYPFGLVITGKSIGTTTVTLTANNGGTPVTKDIKVTVKDGLDRVVIDNSIGDTYIFAGGTTTFKANAYAFSGALMEDVPLTWSSSNNSIATVDNNGVVTAVAPGSANITAAFDEYLSGTRAIRVVAAPEAISEAYGFQGFWDEGDDIVFLDNSDGSLYITGGFADGLFEGSYTLDGAYYMNMDGAKAPATGTVTISKGTGTNQYIVTMNVSINLSSTKSVSFKFSNGIIEYFPE